MQDNGKKYKCENCKDTGKIKIIYMERRGKLVEKEIPCDCQKKEKK